MTPPSFALILSPFIFCSISLAGAYSGPVDTTHAVDPAIPATDSRFVEWADGIDVARTMFAPNGSRAIDVAGGFNSLGELNVDAIASGLAPGFITVTFPSGVANDAGHDFAVFENGFVVGSEDSLFAELAYVEVSTNGQDFARFPSVSMNTSPSSGSGPFSGFNMTHVYNLAGKHAAGYGTPFDLEELCGDPAVMSGLIDLHNVQFVRLVDIPGSGDYLDSLGNPILDAWPTEGSGGFDFRLGPGVGVGVLGVATVPEPNGCVFIVIGFLLAQSRCRRTKSVPRNSQSYCFGIILATSVFVVAGGLRPLKAETVVNFEELTVFTTESPAGGGSFYNGNEGSGVTNRDGWTSQGVFFSNRYNGDSLPAFDFWDGWAYSNVSNTTTAGFTNQYASVAGGGSDGNRGVAVGEHYAIAYQSGSYFDVPEQLRLDSIDVTNTTFAALSLLNGDSFAKRFGGVSGDDPDLFQVDFVGYELPAATGSVLDRVSVVLADYRFVDNRHDFVLDHWQTVDLSAIAKSKSVGLEFASTDVGDFGINTPTYVAVDNIRLRPVPESFGIGVVGYVTLTAVASVRRRKRR